MTDEIYPIGGFAPESAVELQSKAEAYAMENCRSCNERRYQGPCECHQLESAYLAGATRATSALTAEIIDQLKEMNPYKFSSSHYEKIRWVAYISAVVNARKLLTGKK